MGALNGKHKLSHELSDEDVELIKSETNMPTDDIYSWYQDYLEFNHSRDLNEEKFVKKFKEILPHEGEKDEFARLAFYG